MKCDHKNEKGNFCSNCGATLREICDLHNIWEEIGLSCRFKINEAKEKLKGFIYTYLRASCSWLVVSATMDNVITFSMFGACLIPVILVVVSMNTGNWFHDFVYLVTPNKLSEGEQGMLAALYLCFFFLVIIFIAGVALNRKRNIVWKLAKKEFFQLHPDYAEILKKAEDDK